MHLKLSYFDFGGRVTPARLALTIGKIDFVDERIPYDQWGAISGDRTRFPLGALPVLEVDGRVYCESTAIAEYCAELAGLAPKDAKDRLDVMQALLTMEEIFSGENGFAPTVFLDADAKRAARQTFVETNLTFHAARLEKLLEQSGTGYFGKSLSVADLNWLVAFQFFTCGDADFVPTTVFDGFPLLNALKNRVASLEAVQAFFKANPSG